MGLDDLTYLSDRQAGPQPKGKTRLEEKEEKDASTDKAWEVCKRAVDKRDGIKCRICKKTTVVTLELDPKRAEHAHIVRRSKEKTLKYDSRNVFKSCHRCHRQFDTHEIKATQKAEDMFDLNGKQYLNADKLSLTFTKAA